MFDTVISRLVVLTSENDVHKVNGFKIFKHHFGAMESAMIISRFSCILWDAKKFVKQPDVIRPVLTNQLH